MCCSDQFGGCFFTKRVHILVKDFQDYQSLLSCRDNQSHLLFFTFSRLSKSVVMQRQSRSSIFRLLFKDYQSLLSCKDNHGYFLLYFSKTIRVFCCAGTIKVIYPFTFQRLSESFASETTKSVGSQRRLWSSTPLHFKDFNVFCQDYHSLLYIFKTIKVCCHAETIMVICLFTFPRLSESFMSRQLQSSLHFQDYQSLLFQDYHNLLYFSKTIKVCCLAETINVFRPLHFQRPSESSIETSMSPLLCKTSRSFVDIPDASYTPSFDRFSLLGLPLVADWMVRSFERN